jgi:hypothetical protein
MNPNKQKLNYRKSDSDSNYSNCTNGRMTPIGVALLSYQRCLLIDDDVSENFFCDKYERLEFFKRSPDPEIFELTTIETRLDEHTERELKILRELGIIEE